MGAAAILAALPSLLTAAIKALPEIIALIAAIQRSMEGAAQRGIGRDQAFKDMLVTATANLAKGNEAENAARADHAKHADDTAFDQDFFRKE